MKIRSCALPVAGVLSVLLSGAPAQAQATEAAATALFDEARTLMAQHHYAEACPKLAESERLAPSGGTLLNLADCYEHTGQTASAWAAWKDAAGRANAAGKGDAEKKALARAAALEAGLARLTIAVGAESDVAGLEVKRDGVVVGRAEYGSAIPVDPGAHVIDARAPGKQAWTRNVDVAPKQADARVTIVLEVDPSAQAALAETTPGPASAPVVVTTTSTADGSRQTAGSPQRMIGMVTLGAGVVGIAIGSVFGIDAISKNNEALQPGNCNNSTTCNGNGYSLTNEAWDSAKAANIAFGIGAAAAVAGAVVWLTAPSNAGKPASSRLTPLVGPSVGGLEWKSTW